VTYLTSLHPHLADALVRFTSAMRLVRQVSCAMPAIACSAKHILEISSACRPAPLEDMASFGLSVDLRISSMKHTAKCAWQARCITNNH
jgi:hypothetical protein